MEIDGSLYGNWWKSVEVGGSQRKSVGVDREFCGRRWKQNGSQ